MNQDLDTLFCDRDEILLDLDKCLEIGIYSWPQKHGLPGFGSGFNPEFTTTPLPVLLWLPRLSSIVFVCVNLEIERERERD